MFLHDSRLGHFIRLRRIWKSNRCLVRGHEYAVLHGISQVNCNWIVYKWMESKNITHVYRGFHLLLFCHANKIEYVHSEYLSFIDLKLRFEMRLIRTWNNKLYYRHISWLVEGHLAYDHETSQLYSHVMVWWWGWWWSRMERTSLIS